jgi:predicted dehydrogenase
VELVRGGYIGEIKEVQVGLPAGHHDFAGTKDKNTVTPPPAQLDYDKWVGPSTMVDYIEARVHKNWRWHYNFGGGQLLDWVGHHVDIAHWGMNMDNGGPSEVECAGELPDSNAMWNTCTKYRGELKYPNGIKMTIAGGHPDIAMGTKWIGSEGWVYVNRGAFDASNADWKRFRVLPDNMRKAEIYRSGNHFKNWIDCALAGKPTITPVETAHHSAIPGHLCLISMLSRSKVQWDAAKQEIIGNPEATKFLTRAYRSPYQLG